MCTFVSLPPALLLCGFHVCTLAKYCSTADGSPRDKLCCRKRRVPYLPCGLHNAESWSYPCQPRGALPLLCR